MTNYYPSTSFIALIDGQLKNNDFKREWYIQHLEALAEPSLYALVSNPKGYAYRFLWLRTFHNPVAVRISINDDGSADLDLKVTDGQGGYNPGKLIIRKSNVIAKDQIEAFVDKIEELQFWTLSESSSMGIDGALWVLEGVKDGHYNVIDRFSPESGAFREAALMLIQMAQYPVQDVY